MSDAKKISKECVLIARTGDGSTAILAKGPEASYMDQRAVLCGLTDSNGLLDGVQYESAAILGGGDYRKRRVFKAQKAVAKPAKKAEKKPAGEVE